MGNQINEQELIEAAQQAELHKVEIEKELRAVLDKYGYGTDCILLVSLGKEAGKHGFALARDLSMDNKFINQFSQLAVSVINMFVAKAKETNKNECECAECKAARTIENALAFSRPNGNLVN